SASQGSSVPQRAAQRRPASRHQLTRRLANPRSSNGNVDHWRAVGARRGVERIEEVTQRHKLSQATRVAEDSTAAAALRGHARSRPRAGGSASRRSRRQRGPACTGLFHQPPCESDVHVHVPFEICPKSAPSLQIGLVAPRTSIAFTYRFELCRGGDSNPYGLV